MQRKWYRRNAIDALDLHSPSSPCVGLHAQNIMYLFEVRASDLMKKPLKSFREKRKLRKIIRNYVYNTERIFSPPVAPRARDKLRCFSQAIYCTVNPTGTLHNGSASVCKTYLLTSKCTRVDTHFYR